MEFSEIIRNGNSIVIEAKFINNYMQSFMDLKIDSDVGKCSLKGILIETSEGEKTETALFEWIKDYGKDFHITIGREGKLAKLVRKKKSMPKMDGNQGLLDL